jgi:hypothetical protein
MKAVVIVITIILAALPAFAGPPTSGTYKSSNGDFDEGRQATSWLGGGFLSTGNVLHAQSWSGSALGGDWEILCPQVASVTLLVDLVSDGNGQRIYRIDYAGGYLRLDGYGPWAGGDPSYLGPIDTYIEIRTVMFADDVKVGSVSDYSVSGHFNGYVQTCLTVAIGNGVWLGESPAVTPADYPTYNDTACNPTASSGDFGDITDLTLSITGCELRTQSATWGSVKAMYR